MKKTVALSIILATFAFAATPNPQMKQYLQELQAEAKAPFSAERGKEIFFKQNTKDGQTISCASCHTTDLRKNGENKRTGKAIKPLAPSANPQSMTDAADVKKWLKRNFNDVYARQGTAQEKGDVITFLTGL